jgi:hypothetical protein
MSHIIRVPTRRAIKPERRREHSEKAIDTVRVYIMSDQEDKLPPAPTASTSKAFEWSCKCLNVTLSGLDPGEVKGSSGDNKGKKKRVWLSNEGEKIVSGEKESKAGRHS